MLSIKPGASSPVLCYTYNIIAMVAAVPVVV